MPLLLDHRQVDEGYFKQITQFLGLEHRLTHLPSELSGGQQQRVLLSRALCAAGELLILDEPVTGLDPEAAHDMYRTLSYLNRTEGIAIVMVTHDLQNALKYATHILHAGHKGWFFGTAAEFAASPYGKKLGGDGE